jgi:hypothetical protein
MLHAENFGRLVRKTDDLIVILSERIETHRGEFGRSLEEKRTAHPSSSEVEVCRKEVRCFSTPVLRRLATDN